MIGNRRLLVGATAMAIGVALGMATMVAAVNGFTIVQGTGTDINRVKTRAVEGFFQLVDTTSEDGPETAELPEARHRLVLTEETLVVARFQALASCSGDGFCQVQIHVLDNNAGDAFVAAMEPDLFSQWTTEGQKLRGIERSITLSPGDYDFQVVIFATELNSDTFFEFLEWHYTVERIV